MSTKHVHVVDGDGECLFNAIAYGIIYLSTNNVVTRKHYKPLARKLRHETVKLLVEKIRNLEMNFIISMSAELDNSQKDFNIQQIINRAKLYAKKMSRSCTWGGQIELQVLGTLVKHYGYRGIKVYNANTKKLLMHSNIARGKKPIIHLVLHGVSSKGGGGIHYNFWNKKQ